MRDVLIADRDIGTGKRLAGLLSDAGYDVTVANSTVKTVAHVLKRTAQVLILGKEVGKFSAVELVSLLKKCNPNVVIILVADDAPLPMLQKIRNEGIFYHAFRPVDQEGQEEIRQVVKCAMDKVARRVTRRGTERSEGLIALLPELGVTMADGGVPVTNAVKKTTVQRSLRTSTQNSRNKIPKKDD